MELKNTNTKEDREKGKQRDETPKNQWTRSYIYIKLRHIILNVNNWNTPFKRLIIWPNKKRKSTLNIKL